MMDVYTKSHFTIAAGNTNSDTEGFLKLRNRDFATLDVSCFTGDKVRLYISSHSPYYLYDEEVSYLDERGWVLQERFLPSRILRIGSKQNQWEC
jgi:hypothetical protein